MTSNRKQNNQMIKSIHQKKHKTYMHPTTELLKNETNIGRIKGEIVTQ